MRSIQRLISSCCVSAIIILAIMSGSGSAFCPPKPLSLATHRNQRLVFYSEENPQEPAVVETPVGSPKSEGTSYPIPLPSPILLSASMGLAIISTGKYSSCTGGLIGFKSVKMLGRWSNYAIYSRTVVTDRFYF